VRRPTVHFYPQRNSCSSRLRPNPLTEFPFLQRPYDIETGVYHYSESSLKKVAHILGILFASTIPAASIFTLYYVHDMVARLGAILAFSTLFSICLAVFTTARRVEIFGATAAYAFVFALATFLI
jgi:hypothetical protein